MPPGDSRTALLAGAVEYVAANGTSDITLRRLATALGTSHRMLIYHFGSLEGLVTAIVRAVEEEQRRAFAELWSELRAEGLPAGEFAWRFWERLADESMWARERLFFELYGQALQGRPGTASFLAHVVDDWLEPLAEWTRDAGFDDEEDARAAARLGMAATRGLLLDLLATGDRAAVDAAMRRLIRDRFPEYGTPTAGS